MEALKLELLGDLESARDVWEPLAARSRNIFSTWEWASCWWQQFGSGRRLRLTACREDGNVVAVLPLYLASGRPLRRLRLIGHGPADELGPVCAPEEIEPVARALHGGLANRFWDWELFIGDRLPGNYDWPALIGSNSLEREPGPSLRIDGQDWDGFLAARSSNFREQARRRERKLAREHELSYRLTTPERLDEDISTLVRLHASRWGARSKAFTGRVERFHRDFAAAALARGWLRLWVMEVNGAPVAAWYGFRYGGVESYYNSGRDPAWDRYRVGFVLLVHTIREAFRDGMREYRLLRGGEEYKSRFANEDRGTETVGLARGLGRAGASLAKVAHGAMPYRLKRRLAGLDGP